VPYRVPKVSAALLFKPTLPVLVTEKRLVVDALLVVEPIAKSTFAVSPKFALTESLANGEVVPMPTRFEKYAVPVFATEKRVSTLQQN
jgi:hypothetical protein